MTILFKGYLKNGVDNRYFYIIKYDKDICFKSYEGKESDISEDSSKLETTYITDKIYKKFKKDFLTKISYFENVEDTNIEKESEWSFDFVEDKLSFSDENHNLPLYVYTMLEFITSYFKDLYLAGELDGIKPQDEVPKKEVEKLISAYLVTKEKSEFIYIIKDEDEYFISIGTSEDGSYIELSDIDIPSKKIDKEEYELIIDTLKDATSSWKEKYGDYDEGEDQWSIKYNDLTFTGYEEYPDNFKEIFNMIKTGEVVKVKLDVSDLGVSRLKYIKSIMEFEDGTTNDLDKYIKDNKELIKITQKIIDNLKD